MYFNLMEIHWPIHKTLRRSNGVIIMSFVFCTDPKAHSGLGKVIGVDTANGECSVEYFFGPMEEFSIVTVPLASLTESALEKHNRAYVKDASGSWRFGRVIDGEGNIIEINLSGTGREFFNLDEVYIRCDLPISDPSLYLSAWINENPQIANARSKFRQNIIEQRQACLGMTALLSSVIDLEPHQLKVVRKVLQDPIQRYLLADEVGLGKTIEAGIIIKQYLLDYGNEAKKVVIIIPESLLQQWQTELENRFSLRNFSRIILVGMNAVIKSEGLLEDVGMVVIDEAHHLNTYPILYDIISNKTKSLSHFLLLSATPVTANEEGFLKLLKLLDPNIYSGVQLKEFKERISRRQSISEISAGLVPENLYVMREFTNQLSTYFENDKTLQILTDKLSTISSTYPDEDDVEFCGAIDAVKDHLSEVYRLDRRILKNRRSEKNIVDLTPKRSGIKVKKYNSNNFQILQQELSRWSNEVAAITKSYEDQTHKTISKDIFDLYSAISQYDQDLVDEIIKKLPADFPDLKKISEYSNAVINEFNRDDALKEVLEEIFLNNEKAILFCSSASISQRLFDDLEYEQPGTCARRSHENALDKDTELSRFKSNAACRLLICDQRDEEGLNFQGICKTIIHYDSVMSPNRIEQRIGRLDRYGSGDPIDSIVLSCRDNPLEVAWLQFLDDGLQVYSQSIASLQYLIDKKMREIQEQFLIEGVEVVYSVKDKMRGDTGETSREIRDIKHQEQLEAMSEEDDQWLDNLLAVDDKWEPFYKNSNIWLQKVLHIKKQPIDVPGLNNGLPEAEPFRFQMRIGGPGNVLIPLGHINTYLADGIDHNATGISRTNILSHIYTHRRQTALTEAALRRKVRLFKLGDQFNSGMEKLTSMDDRGRVFAHWRVHAGAPSIEKFEKFIKFEFLIEGDTSAMEKFALDRLGQDSNFSKTSLRRKIDTFFIPIWTRIWLSDEYTAVTDESLLSILDKQFIPRTKRNTESTDLHLSQSRVAHINRSGLLDDWSEFVTTAKARAIGLILKTDNLTNETVGALKKVKVSKEKRRSVMQVRQNNNSQKQMIDGPSSIEFEEQMTDHLEQGISNPKIHIESVGAILLSDQKYSEAFPE